MKEIYKIFPDAVCNIVQHKKLIPRRLKFKEKLKQFHKYYLEDYGIIKVKEIFTENDTEYYIISYYDNRSACIPYPVDNYDTNFELLLDYNKIAKHNIINEGISYTGAEIRFWFIVNNIDFSKDSYSGFLPYLTRYSNKDLIDNKKYFVTYDCKTNKFDIYLDE